MTAATPSPTHRPHWQTAAICTGLNLPLLMWFWLVGSAGHDDSHISFWAAWSLNHLGELLNYNGERIEQSSSLLHVLLTALLARISPLDEVAAGYGVNYLAAWLTPPLVWCIARRRQWANPWLPALMTASSAFFAYWALSGMETALTALCVLLFIETALQAHLAAAVLAALALALVRPEMLMAGPLWLLMMTVLRQLPWQRAVLLLVPFALLPLWRHHAFGVWLANPVYAKAGGLSLAQLGDGLLYALRLTREPSLVALILITVILTACSLRRASSRNPALPFVWWTLIYAAFVLTSGGDWMKEGRFWVPLIAPALLAAAAGLPTQPTLRAACITALLTLQWQHAGAFLQQSSFGMRWPQQAALADVFPQARFWERSNREHLRDLPAIDTLGKLIDVLYQRHQRPLTLASKQMGLVNYRLATTLYGHFRVMDMAGLVDNSLRRCPPLARDGFDAQGMRLNWRKLFERLPQTRTECSLQPPDIIYDLYGWGETVPLPDFLQAQGYQIVFVQRGRVNLQPGADISAQEVIAVRRELLEGTGIQRVEADMDALLQAIPTGVDYK